MSQLLEPNTLLAERYRIVRSLGVGGMGAVFEAENIVTHKRVAVKWLRPLVAARSEAAQRLLREAQAASRVRHANVVDVYDVVRDGETLFLVLELLEGEPLEHVFERENMPLWQLLRVLAQALRGVAAAHKQGVVHRDLHPGNIFVIRQPDNSSDEYTAKVLDFGISKVIDSTELAITQPGMTLGTPLYMSYEQLRGAADIDARTDVYSCGVILYEALTGRLPFEAGSLPELAVRFATSKPSSVRRFRPSVPEALDRVIATALARDREQRPASVEPLIKEVEAFANELRAVAPRSGSDALFDEVRAHQISTLGRRDISREPTLIMKRRPDSAAWKLSLIAACCAALTCAGFAVVLRAKPEQSPAQQSGQRTESAPRITPPARPFTPAVKPVTPPAATSPGAMGGSSALAEPAPAIYAPAASTAHVSEQKPGRALGASAVESLDGSRSPVRSGRAQKREPTRPPSEEPTFRTGRPPRREDF